MDAKAFGTFLAETRRDRGLTQSELAAQLHVTDKAVSRWERGLGFPDINTLEPLADALGLTLAQLMHADRGDGTSSERQTLEDFFAMLAPNHIQWQTVPTALFWLTVAVAVVALFTLPMKVTVGWDIHEGGVLLPSRVLLKPVVYLMCVAFSALWTQIWKAAERGVFMNSIFLWGRAFHPRLFPWLELALHLVYAWMCLSPLFAETMILLFN